MVNVHQPIMNPCWPIEGGQVRRYLSSCSAVYLQNDCDPSTSQLTVWKTNNMADAPVTINIYDPASTYMSHHLCVWSTTAFFSILNGLKHDYKLGPAQDSVGLQGVGKGGEYEQQHLVTDQMFPLCAAFSAFTWHMKCQRHDVVVVLKVDQRWRWEVFLRVESADPLAPLCGEVPANYTGAVFTSTAMHY